MYEPLRADLRDRLPAAAGAVHADGADVTARSLLETAVAPEDAQAVFDDKVAHRPVLLRPSRSQQPDGRMARRARRQARLAEQGRKRKARPLSAREKRALAKSEAGGKRLAFAQMQGLHELWLEYARDVVGSPLSGHRTAIEERLLGLDLHGAAIRVTACTCPSRVGVAGICVKETKQTLVLVTQANETKTLPKKGLVFSVHVDDTFVPAHGKPTLAFEVFGSHIMQTPAARATYKFKSKPTVAL